MRRRRRSDLKSPSVSDSEYYTDGHQPARDAPSDHYHSSDTDSPVAALDSPSPSGSTLPPPSTTQFTSDLKAPPDDPDLSDNDKEHAWYEFDHSVVLALLSPVVNWLTGSDHVKNILLIFLIVFYLHQIIEGPSSLFSSFVGNDVFSVPWSLYLASRPRRPLHTLPHDYTSTADRYHRAAQSELHALEIFYLTLSILSPFLGATLLRTVVISFSGPSTVSWFSLSLFVLSTGMRPWKHAIQRLRQRTLDLHTIVHYPPSEFQKMDTLIDRVVQLEAELQSLREQSKSFNSDIYDHVEDAVGMMEIATRRQDKKAEVSKVLLEGRLVKLEQNLETLLERMEIRADRPALYRMMTQISMFASSLVEQLSPILPTWVVVRWRGSISRSPRCSPKMPRTRSSIKLETIPEVATFQPKSSVQPSRYFPFPGLGLALRICNLATLPLRCIFAYILAGQMFSSRAHT